MAVGVGVVVSAFRLTPFSWQGAELEELLIQQGVGAQQNAGTLEGETR